MSGKRSRRLQTIASPGCLLQAGTRDQTTTREGQHGGLRHRRHRLHRPAASIRLLAARGEEVVCMDINPGAASFEDLGKQVRVIRGDVTQFDDVMAAALSAKPSRDHQSGVLARQRARAAPGDAAEHRRHGQLLRGRAAGRRQACGVRELDCGERQAEALRRPHDHRGRSATAKCSTRCTRSSTSGRRRTTTRNTA